MSPKVRTEDLIDAQGVAEILGLSHRSSVSTYLHRYADMPRPVVDLPSSKTRLWVRQDIIRWVRGSRRRRQKAGAE